MSFSVNIVFSPILKIVDYSQNLYLPNFVSGKSDDAYYYSPLNLYKFVVVGVLNVKYLLHSYIIDK